MLISEGGGGVNPRNNFLKGFKQKSLIDGGGGGEGNIKWNGPVTLSYYESISSNKQTYRLYSNVVG